MTDMALCVKNTIRLRSGLWFDFQDPRAEQVSLEDIAGSLSKLCRFGGHGNRFYSVAEHSYHCAMQAAEDGLAIAAQVAVLFHDASEAYAGDVVKPLKVMLPDYEEIESRVEASIAERFKIDFERHRATIREIDRSMLIAERNAMFSEDGTEWTGEHEVRPLEVQFQFWQPHVAEAKFTRLANDLLSQQTSGMVAFTGVARAGKDEAGQALIDEGYVRRCFGDIIKRQVDPLVRQYLGFSAFTQNDAEKNQIRAVLEHWGDSNYDGIMAEYFDDLPKRCVNTRLVRVREAQEWRKRGGIVVEIKRIGYGPASNWERDCLNELRQAGMIDHTILNDGSIEDLQAKVRSYCLEIA